MSNKRIVVVGGGSQFSVSLVESLVDYAQDMLAGSTVVLLDLHEEHVNIVQKYASTLAQKMGVDLKFESTIDRRRAFDGADYILTTFRPGSHQEQEQDETIPPKYGLQGNETVGIGGIFMACRVVPVLRDICADAEAMCPDAWIINYTNPTQYVADAVRRISDLRVVSLCDGYIEVAEDLAPLLEVEPSDITVYPAGTNHSMWIMRFTVKGQDGYPILKERLSGMSQADIDELYANPPNFDFLGIDIDSTRAYDQFITHNYFPFSLKLFDIYGVLPAPRYYWRYHFDQDAVITEERSGHYMTMANFYMTHTVPRRFQDMDKQLEYAVNKLKTIRREGGGSHGDLAVRFISAMVNDLGEIFDVNVPNQGAISNLPDDAIVEVAATVDHLGPHPFSMGPLPKSLWGYQHSLVLSQQLAIDAALSGNRNDLLQAILAHPLIRSVNAAEKAMDELLTLQRDWLPQFAQ